MDKVSALEAFIQKWEPSILDALNTIGEAVHRAGYNTSDPYDEIDLPEMIRWLMPVGYPGRPAFLESMDMFISFTIVQPDVGLLPFLEVFNREGSYLDNINISDPLAMDDTSGWEKAMETAKGKANDVVGILEEYFPKPTKRIWKIHVTTPEGVKTHPSLHTNEDIAKQDVSIRLAEMLYKISRLFWEFEAVRMYSAWTSSSSYALAQIHSFLEQGEIWKALLRYHVFIDSMSPSLRDRVTKTVGSLSVERRGGYQDEDGD